MKFSVSERMLLLGLLPREGNIATLRVVHDLQQQLSFSEEELGALDIRQEGTQVRWSAVGAEKVGLKEVPLGRAARQLIVDALQNLESKKKLPITHLGLYERFVGGDEEANE